MNQAIRCTKVDVTIIRNGVPELTSIFRANAANAPAVVSIRSCNQPKLSCQSTITGSQTPTRALKDRTARTRASLGHFKAHMEGSELRDSKVIVRVGQCILMLSDGCV